jgi:MFS family permease
MRMSTGKDLATQRPATYRELFASREYVALWSSQVISLTGDQLARVAVASLVFDRTGSASATALVYAVTYLPWLIGGPLLGGLADRYARRRIMVGCLLVSAVLVTAMAIPAMPVLALAVLLFLVILAESPYLSARAALLLDVLPDDRYVLASSVGQLTVQGTQVLGFAVGGAFVATMGSTNALLVDAASFVIAAALIAALVHRRRSAAAGSDASFGTWRRIATGAAIVFTDPWLRTLTLLAWLASLWVVPEALAAPLAAGDPATIGLILAAQPAGSVIGGIVLARLVRPDRRLRLMGPLALLATVPLLSFAAHLPTPVVLASLVLSGLGTAYNLPANAALMQGVPTAHRGQAFGLVSAGLIAGQGLGIAAAGALAGYLGSAHQVVALAGLAGTLGVAWLTRQIHASPELASTT